jgi:hyperosmotically inducible protein
MIQRWYGIVLAAGAVACGGCNQAQEDRAAANASQAVHEANQALRQAGSVAREGVREAGELARDAGQKARESDAGALLKQGTITAKVKTALLADQSVPGTKIDVDTQGAVVTLSGRLTSQEQIDRAVAIARGIDGVQSVENRLTLQQAPG